MNKKQVAKHVSRLVDHLVALNQVEASRIAAMGFKLDLPVALLVSFRADTYEHAASLTESLKDMGFFSQYVRFDNRYWNISSTIKMPITTFISEPFTKRLATTLFNHNCSLRKWQKQYL